MALRASELEPGQRFEQVVVDGLTRTQIVQYAGASGDFHPLHTDEVYATEVAGYPTVFAHGMLTMALTGKLLTDVVGNGRLLTFSLRFLRQVWPGDTLTATAEVAAVRTTDDGPVVELRVATVNQDALEVVAGEATARLDP